MIQIEYGTRSAKEAIGWTCLVCGAFNEAREKLLFNLPKFVCDCGKEKYFDRHTLDFSIADIKVNGTPLVQGVYMQTGGECVPNALCKGMEILDVVDSLKKHMERHSFKSFKPSKLVQKYEHYYPLMAAPLLPDENVNPTTHKLIKMLLILIHEGIEVERKEGIEMEDLSLHKIGGVSMIEGDDYEAILEELADGYPLLGLFIAGHSFDSLNFCEWYIPPTITEMLLCNMKPDPHQPHELHMGLLLGPACREGEQGFHYINSYGVGWCSRKILDGTENAASGGLSKIPKDALMSNVIKLWQPGEVASGSMVLVDEDESEELKYTNCGENIEYYYGELTEKMMVKEGWIGDESGYWKYYHEGKWFYWPCE